jgi:uncharacterized protein (TIGR00661 family)
MKILYAIQATGNGHISRAREIYPLLSQIGQVDTLLSGTQSEIQPGFEVKYRINGLGFTFGKQGGIDFISTLNKISLFRLKSEYDTIPVENYDLVINDFEPVTAWSCYFNKVPCISLSHQSAFLHSNVPRPSEKDTLGEFILSYYAPAKFNISFHFESYHPDILFPVIRKEIRALKPQNKGHFTVYLPAYDEVDLARMLSSTSNYWHVFSKRGLSGSYDERITFFPVNHEKFTYSLVQSAGVLCGAGFETPAEALFLGKKLMVVPMINQYEQYCNAASLSKMGVTALPKGTRLDKNTINQWMEEGKSIEIKYPDQSDLILEKVAQYYRLFTDTKHSNMSKVEDNKGIFHQTETHS